MTSSQRRKRPAPSKEKPRKRNKTSRGAVIADVHRALGKLERRRAIRAAQEEFDHDEAHVHDREIKDGAPDALIRMLVFVLRKVPKERAGDNEIGKICECLAFIYCGCHGDASAAGFKADIDGLMINALLRVLKMAADGGIVNDGDLAAKSAARILDCFACSDDAAVKSSLANNRDVLGTLMKTLKAEVRLGEDTRTKAIYVLINLLNTNNKKDNATIGGHARLIQFLGNAARSAMQQPEISSDESSRYVSALAQSFFNLSISTENKRRIVESEICLRGLCALLTSSRDPCTKKYAARAVANMACANKFNVCRLIRHDNGAFLKGLTDLLCNGDYSRGGAEEAASSLRNMVSFEDARQIMAFDKKFLEVLLGIAIEPEKGPIHGRVVCLLGRLVQNMSHSNFLVTIQLCSGIEKCYLELVRGMSYRSHDKRKVKTEFACDQVFAFLVEVLQTEDIGEDTLQYAIRVLWRIATHEDNAPKMSRNKDVIHVLAAYAVKVTSSDFFNRPADDQPRKEAVEALSYIIHDGGNTAQLAKMQGVRLAIEKFVAYAINREERDDAEKALRMLDLAEGSPVVSP